MVACVNNNPPHRLGVVLMLVGMIVSGVSAAAGFQVATVEARIVKDRLTLAGHLELALTPKVEEALDNGIPIEFAIDVHLYRQRVVLWDETVTRWALRRQLRYHALSGQYLVSSQPAFVSGRDGFDSLAEALTQIGTLGGVALPLPETFAADGYYRAEVRVVLDVEALPTLLRPLAYTSSAWRLDSGWSAWQVRR